jgi:hypothetical protein
VMMVCVDKPRKEEAAGDGSLLWGKYADGWVWLLA